MQSAPVSEPETTTACEEEDPTDDTGPEYSDAEVAMMEGKQKSPEELASTWQRMLSMKRLRDVLQNIPDFMISQFTEMAFRMPTQDGMGFENFSFEGRRHMRHIYDTPAQRVLLICARQVEKSTAIGNRAISYSCLIPGFKTLYVSPTSTQSKTFSTDRLKEPIETSPILKSFTTNMLSQNVFEKQFVNWSKITLRNAFLNADRTRGIPAWMLALDEFQDILSDNVPIIEQCTSHAPDQWKKFFYTGTPKSTDNNIEYYRAGFAKNRPMSSQSEWIVPCDKHGGDTGPWWNVLSERNIGKKGLICERCGSLINAQHEDARWANMVDNGIFESYRIPQLMVPWMKWDEILLNYSRYPRDKFYNEVLGLSYDSGMRPLNMAQVQACCRKKISMHPDTLDRYKPGATDHPVFAGVDWGTGENTYTLVTLGTYVDNKFRIIYAHRCTGVELEPPVQMKMLIDLFKDFNVSIIGSDYGGGFDRNDLLVRAFGPMKVAKFQYLARAKRKVEWDPKLRRYKVHRTEVMSDIFNAIKRGMLDLPRWEEFQHPYATDMCNIFSEYNETLRMIQYDHRPDKPDDTFHSILYCWLASMIKYARPDIIAPLREDQNRGPIFGGYGGPTWQG